MNSWRSWPRLRKKFRQAEQDHQRATAYFTGIFTNTENEALAAPEKIAVAPALTGSGLQNPLQTITTANDAPMGV
jgi:hypothetical protein